MTYTDTFDVVWSGGPLLPPRRSKPPRWWTMGGAVAFVEHDPKETERLRNATRTKRAYNKTGKHGRAPMQPPLEVTCSREEHICQTTDAASGLNTVTRFSAGPTTRGEMGSGEPNAPIDVCGSLTSGLASPDSLTVTKHE